MRCPVCNSIDVGKVETDQYYCWNCLHGFSLKGVDGFSAYYVDEEGALVSLAKWFKIHSCRRKTSGDKAMFTRCRHKD